MISFNETEARMVANMQALREGQRAADMFRVWQRPPGYDPDGVFTVAGAKAAYVRGDIELDEFEVRVDQILRGR